MGGGAGYPKNGDASGGAIHSAGGTIANNIIEANATPGGTSRGPANPGASTGAVHAPGASIRNNSFWYNTDGGDGMTGENALLHEAGMYTRGNPQLRRDAAALGAASASHAPPTDIVGRPRPPAPAIGAYEFSPTSGDFNHNDVADILFYRPATGQLYIWYDQLASNGANVNGAGSIHWKVVASNDFNGDGHTDLFWQHAVTGQNYIWYLNGIRIIGESNVNNAGPQWKVKGAWDFDDDRKPDLVWQHSETNQIYLWYMNGAMKVGEANLGDTASSAHVLGVGDLNRDGLGDVIVRSSNGGPIQVNSYERDMTGGQHLIAVDVPQCDPVWRLSAIADLDNDGWQDLVWQRQFDGTCVTWYLRYQTIIRTETGFHGVQLVNAEWQPVTPK